MQNRKPPSTLTPTPPDEFRPALAFVFRRMAARGRELRAARLARVGELVEARPDDGESASPGDGPGSQSIEKWDK